MPDYSLGRAHGKISIDYDGSGAQKAARDLDRVAAESDDLDKSLTKTQKSLRETERELGSTSKATRAYADDIDDASESHERFADSARDAAHEVRELDDVEENRHRRGRIRSRDRDHDIDAMRRSVDGLHDLRSALNTTEDSTHGLAKGLHIASVAMGLMGPEGRAASIGLESLATKFGIVGDGAQQAGHHIRDFVKHIASFELSVGKTSGLALGGGALGGLAGLGGAAGLMGVTQMAGAVRQLSGALGLLPAAISAAAFSMGTLKIAFHGVGDALKDMMADDPKKFLEDIKNMGPVAGKAMLQIAQFRNLFKLAGASIQDSFFSQVINDIQPLIQTWLPAVTKGMSQVAGMYGQMAHQFAGLLMQPQMMQTFQMFIDNLSKGMQAMAPALEPLLKIFTQLTVIGSSFFAEIGGRISTMLNFFSSVIDKAAASGSLQRWIQSGIDAISHLINMVYSVGAAFNHIMDIADRFGGGGLLGWLDKIAAQLNGWTQSASGQKSLIDFFTVLRQATDAFTPMLQPILEGLVALGSAFTQLGIAIAPGWQTFFNTFAQSMQQLGPSIIGIAPAINQFLVGLSQAFAQLMSSVGPQLPQIFMGMSNAFVALLPQLQPLTQAFLDLTNAVGPQLPKLFEAVTNFLISTQPYWPIIIGFVRDFVSVITKLIEGSTGITDFFSTLLSKLKDAVVPGLEKLGEDGGKALLRGLIKGLGDATGINGAIDSVKRIMSGISDFFQHSPAKKGPFSGDGYTGIVGRKMITDMAAGMTGAAGSVAGAASSVMSGVAASLTGAPGPGGSNELGGSLLPDRIAGADNSILSAYLRHDFDDNRGLKGLAKNLGQLTDAGQGLSDLAQHASSLAMGVLGIRGDLVTPVWSKTISDEELARRKKTGIGKNEGPTWGDLLGPGAANMPSSTPLNVTSSSGAQDIQQAIVSAGRQRGLSDADIQTALAIAAAESNFNPKADGGIQGSAGWVGGLYQQSPSSGWGTKAQVLDPSYAINKFYEAFVKNLAKNSDPFIAGVLTQNPQLGGSAGSSAYADAVRAQMDRAGKILAQHPSQGKGPSWGDVLGPTPAPPVTGMPTPSTPSSGGISVPKRFAPNVLPSGVEVPQVVQGAATPSGGEVASNPLSQATRIPSAPNVEAGIRAVGGLPGVYPTSGPGAYQVPAWANQLAKMFNLTASTYSSGGSLHQMGFAFDFNGAKGDMEKFAQFVQSNLASQTLQLIYRGSKDYGIASGRNTPPSYYAGDLPGHADHVHWATDTPPLIMGPDGKIMPVAPVSKMPDFAIGTGSPGPGNFGRYSTGAQFPMLSGDNNLDKITNRDLASQIAAAQAPGASDETVKSTLNAVSRNIAQLRVSNADGNKDQIEELTKVQNSLSQEHGFTQQNPLQQVQQGAGNVGKIIGDVFKDVKSGIEALGSSQDIADRLVYGVRNSEDVVKIIQDSQKWITFAANIATTVADVANAIGDFAGMAPSVMGADEVGKAAKGVSQVASIISGVLAGVNEAITMGIEVYHIVGSYVGKFMSSLVGFGKGDLMGDIRYLLNTNTNELETFSEQNPSDKRYGDVPSWMRWYQQNGVNQITPGVGQLNIYAGPGQSPAEMMSESMWMINEGSLNGAVAAANF